MVSNLRMKEIMRIVFAANKQGTRIMTALRKQTKLLSKWANGVKMSYLAIICPNIIFKL